MFVHVPRTGGFSAYAMLGHRTKGGIHRGLEDTPRHFWSFGFVRNPWARLVSCYLHHRHLHYVPPTQGLYPDAACGFETFLDGATARITAAETLAGCKHIARFENFEAEWIEILHRLELGEPKNGIPRRNTTDPSYNYRAFYTDDLRQLVADRCADDIYLGGYSF